MEMCYHMFMEEDTQNLSRRTLSYYRRNYCFFLVASGRTLTGKFAGHSNSSSGSGRDNVICFI